MSSAAVTKLITLPYASSMVEFSIIKFPPSPNLIAPSAEPPLVLQFSRSKSNAFNVAPSGMSKQESSDPVTETDVKSKTVLSPDPCWIALPTLVNVTSVIVKLPTFALADGLEPWRLPAAIAASLVL